MKFDEFFLTVNDEAWTFSFSDMTHSKILTSGHDAVEHLGVDRPHLHVCHYRRHGDDADGPYDLRRGRPLTLDRRAIA